MVVVPSDDAHFSVKELASLVDHRTTVRSYVGRRSNYRSRLMQQLRSLVALTSLSSDYSVLHVDSRADRQVTSRFNTAMAAQSRELHTTPPHNRSPQGDSQLRTDASKSSGSHAGCVGARELPDAKSLPTKL